ncbi:MAG: hypothetical protein OEQ81_10225 [Flavobacteriaceae bacterium]|nr:hypothetical protein [Flavobacteriaceae bacterium]
MKEEFNIDEMMDGLKGSFDFREPQEGHQARFQSRLEDQTMVVYTVRKRINWWKPYAIAASIALIGILGLGLINLQTGSVENQVAQIAPELPQTKMYFANLVEDQLISFEQYRNEDTEKLIQDAMKQMTRLESDYLKLEKELIDGRNKEVIMQAMIQNFQSRMDILNLYMTKIKMIEQLKTNNDENIII